MSLLLPSDPPGSDSAPLSTWGWNAHVESAWRALPPSSALRPARVASAHRDRWIVATATGLRPAVRAGHAALIEPVPPCVGDWVALDVERSADTAVITATLPARTLIRRLAAGGHDGEQRIAANVDTVLVVGGLDGDHQPRRLRRYVAVAAGGGCRVAIVLNKADLHPDPAAAARGLHGLDPGIPIIPLSAHDPVSLQPVRALLRPGETFALLGSSGVGKSTLVNALLGCERQATGAVRSDDSRGRHTTTARELVPHAASDAILLDTPGMRELALASDADLAAGFADLAAFAARCRFRDCGHGNEPGCAVRAAIAEGALPGSRLSEVRKLEREMAREARRAQHLAATHAGRRADRRRRSENDD